MITTRTSPFIGFPYGCWPLLRHNIQSQSDTTHNLLISPLKKKYFLFYFFNYLPLDFI